METQDSSISTRNIKGLGEVGGLRRRPRDPFGTSLAPPRSNLQGCRLGGGGGLAIHPSFSRPGWLPSIHPSFSRRNPPHLICNGGPVRNRLAAAGRRPGRGARFRPPFWRQPLIKRCKNEGFLSKRDPKRDFWEARADLANAHA